MNSKKYSRITQGCVIVAVASALLFDQTNSGLRIIAVILGIAAGLTATIIYFYNQRITI